MAADDDQGPDGFVWDLDTWFLRVAEALDLAAQLKGNSIAYGSADRLDRHHHRQRTVRVSELPVVREEISRVVQGKDEPDGDGQEG